MCGGILKRVRFGAAQLGRKSGKEQSLAMLVDSTELPGRSWRMLDERTWRTGVIGSSEEEATRAREIGSVTAWRSYENIEYSWSLWMQVIPFVNVEDAMKAVPKVAENLLKNNRSQVVVTDQRFVDGGEINGVNTILRIEQLTSSDVGTGSVKYFAGNVGEVMFALGTAMRMEFIDWGRVDELAIIQASKIRHFFEDFRRKPGSI
jgi:hypothetical protein